MSNKVNIKKIQILSNEKYTLKKITFECTKKDGTSEEQIHEVYDMGNATTVFLYNSQQKTVILTKQFRLPSFINGNKTGILIETCAGKIDNESPEDGIKREIKDAKTIMLLLYAKVHDLL